MLVIVTDVFPWGRGAGGGGGARLEGLISASRKRKKIPLKGYLSSLMNGQKLRMQYKIILVRISNNYRLQRSCGKVMF